MPYSISGMEAFWDDRYQQHTSLLKQLSCHGNHSDMSVINLSCIEFTFGTELGWDNRHQPHTLLLWKLGCHGNQSKTSITSLSKVLLSSYLVRRFLETIGISHIPHSNHSEVSISPFQVILSLYLLWRFFEMKASAAYLIAVVTQFP